MWNGFICWSLGRRIPLCRFPSVSPQLFLPQARIVGSVLPTSLLSVIHHIHCLKVIRSFIYGQYEHVAGLSREIERGRMWAHVDHCLLSLKNVIECKADATPVILASHPDGGTGWTLKDAPRLCKNYQGLMDSYKRRIVCSTHCNSDEIYGGGEAAFES